LPGPAQTLIRGGGWGVSQQPFSSPEAGPSGGSLRKALPPRFVRNKCFIGVLFSWSVITKIPRRGVLTRTRNLWVFPLGCVLKQAYPLLLNVPSMGIIIVVLNSQLHVCAPIKATRQIRAQNVRNFPHELGVAPLAFPKARLTLRPGFELNPRLVVQAFQLCMPFQLCAPSHGKRRPF